MDVRFKYSGKFKEKCQNYGKSRHLRRDYKEEEKKKNLDSKDDSRRSSQDEGDAFILSLATHVLVGIWLIDFGGSFHMTSH